MNKKNIKIIITVTAIVLVLTVIMIQIGEKNKTKKVTVTSTSALSNKKIGWGIKRNDNHEQPDLGKTNKEILEKNNGIAIGNNNDKFIY